MTHVPGCYGCETRLICPRHGARRALLLALLVAVSTGACSTAATVPEASAPTHAERMQAAFGDSGPGLELEYTEFQTSNDK
jgi:hypothetical protein